MSVSVFSVFKRTFCPVHVHPPPSLLLYTATAAQRLKSLGLCKSRGVIKRKNKRGRNVGNILLLLSLSHGLIINDPELTTTRPGAPGSRPGAHHITTFASSGITTSRPSRAELSSSFSLLPYF